MNPPVTPDDIPIQRPEPVQDENWYAEVLLALPPEGTFSYRIPEEMQPVIQVGQGVQVPFGSRNTLTGIIRSIHSGDAVPEGIRDIQALAELRPIVNEAQFELWSWIADYYMCSEGEVMKAAISAGLKPEHPARRSHEIRISLSDRLSEEETLAKEMALLHRRAPVRAALMERFLEALKCSQSAHFFMKKTDLIHSPAETSILKALAERNFLHLEDHQINFRETPLSSHKESVCLSPEQTRAKEDIQSAWTDKQTVLLHGVTSSGKTEIYIRLIEEEFKKGNQVLFLLPEISVTAQMVIRLGTVFGTRVRLYHSKHSESERTTLWWDLMETEEPLLILGTRSAVFLPFSKLGLVIVDEEQETSYKQSKPAPRYHARDTAIVLAKLHQAKTLLGSATPSIESLFNAKSGKYGWVQLRERYSGAGLPLIKILDVLKAKKQYWMKHPLFHPELIESIAKTLEKKEQILVFQNRRGFSNYLQCTRCGGIPHCRYCDVSLTWHKQSNRLVCHYCGYSIENKGICPDCHQPELKTSGSGTEKVEEELGLLFPEASIARIDTDAVRTPGQWKIMIQKIENGEIDILVGTQMISKGFDFGNITLTAIVNADLMLNFPDFRAYERTFQMLTQVGGRSGRRNRQGTVLIQTMQPDNRTLNAVRNYDQTGMLEAELADRKTYGYPPYVRLIRISLKHIHQDACRIAARKLAEIMREVFKNSILGPEAPLVEKIRGQYCQEILLKMESRFSLDQGKHLLRECLNQFKKQPESKGIRIFPDVDPV